MTARLVCLAALAMSEVASAADVILMNDRTTRTGTVTGLDAQFFRMRLTLTPAHPNAEPASVTVAIPRRDVARITFAPDPAFTRLLASATSDPIGNLTALWDKQRPWLSVPCAPAAAAGLALGEALLRSNDHAQSLRAVSLFQQIETESWDDHARAEARQGRLRAMIATGQAEAAAREAAELAETSEDPALLIDAKYVLAEAASRALQQLEKDHPRWSEDPFVRPERERLFHEAIDLFLYPSLFFGSETAPSARGLWRATEMVHAAGATTEACKIAEDLTALYPDTPQASQAREFVATHSPGPADTPHDH